MTSLDQVKAAAGPAAGSTPPDRRGPAPTATGGSGPPASRRVRNRRGGRWWTPWLFLAPALILFLYFKFIPMASALTMSFQEVQPYLGNRWVGGENYATVLSSDA
ncbi:sugar ABC transporter permease, partial [Streptomyces sp. NPDC058548]